MQTSQSAESPCNNAPNKKKMFRWLMGVRRRTLLASCYFECRVLASCLGHLKGKCMTKLMKVCIGNSQRIEPWKCTSIETLDKNKTTPILVFRCWNHKNKRTKSAEIVWGNEWNVYFSIIFVFKLSIRFVALSSLYSKLRFLPVALYHSHHWRSFQNFNWQQNA